MCLERKFSNWLRKTQPFKVVLDGSGTVKAVSSEVKGFLPQQSLPQLMADGFSYCVWSAVTVRCVTDDKRRHQYVRLQTMYYLTFQIPTLKGEVSDPNFSCI